MHEEEQALEDKIVLNFRIFDFVNESMSAFMPLILFGLYVGNANALSLSSIVMTNMMIQNISSSMDNLNQQYEFSLRLYEAIIRLNKFYLIPDKQKNLVNQKDNADFEYALTIKGNFSWGIVQQIDKA